MNSLEGRENADLNGGLAIGPKNVVRTASRLFPGSQELTVPDDPAINDVLRTNLCFVRLGENCYVIKNQYGDEREVPYTASLDQWKVLSGELLKSALDRADAELERIMR